MVTSFLGLLLSFGIPAMQLGLKILPILYQYKILKDESEVREWERRYRDGIEQAEKSAKDPVSAKEQEQNADKDAEDKWQKEFGNGSK
jgi:hypothetical protein